MDIMPYEERCECCGKNKATRLCDVIVGHWCGHPPAGMDNVITCDTKLCDECTFVFRNMDICTKCKKKLKEKLLEE